MKLMFKAHLGMFEAYFEAQTPTIVGLGVAFCLRGSRIAV